MSLQDGGYQCGILSRVRKEFPQRYMLVPGVEAQWDCYPHGAGRGERKRGSIARVQRSRWVTRASMKEGHLAQGVRPG